MTEHVATPEADDLARHAQKMAKKKAARDKIMAGKEGEKGLIIVHTGAGKGKSSSGFGMILRCVAHGMPSAVVQFIKGAWDTGERRLITTHFADLCQFHAMGEGFTWETQDKTRDIAAARAGWEKAKELIRNPEIRMVLLDEINIALRYDYLDIGEVLEFLKAEKPPRGADRGGGSGDGDDAGEAPVPVGDQGPAGGGVLSLSTVDRIFEPMISIT